jgi:hypothetical protein
MAWFLYGGWWRIAFDPAQAGSTAPILGKGCKAVYSMFVFLDAGYEGFRSRRE